MKQGFPWSPDMWMSGMKTSGQFGQGGRKFRQATLEDAVLTCFCAGKQRDEGDAPPFKSFAKQVTPLSELWLRPGWKGTLAWPDEVKAFKNVPLDPKIAERNKAFSAHKKLKHDQARRLTKQGYKQEVATKGAQRGAKVWAKA